MRIPALLVLAVAAIGSAALAGGSGWQTDFERAQKKARKADRPLLVEFTEGEASKKLNKEVFYTAKFKTWARKNVVLVELKYGRPLSKKLTAQYQALKEKYKVEKFPTVLLLDAEGKVVGRPTYEKGGAEAWIQEASELVAAASGAGTWITNYEEAKKLAKRTKKPMLVDFNGSDW